MNWLVTGHFYRRSIMDKYEALQYLRDGRLKDPYAVLGLENVDEAEDECENFNGNYRTE
ncbi:hypothetical protein BDFB_005741 [Asbolus verrucosus]|uniref:Uncharacterized protein n=1 Tax=Asbolus verrucosus TaxID=1661398 RepID=A0A482VY54_ASBVE|nr:hypothetical protein BDFB_005741 [Asbolus verrucosus]